MSAILLVILMSFLGPASSAPQKKGTSAALASRGVRIADPKTARTPEPQIVRLAWQIWYPLEKKPEVNALFRVLKRQLDSEDWSASIQTAEKFTPMIPAKRPEYLPDQTNQWSAVIGELHLFNAEPDVAIAALQRLLDSVPKSMDDEIGGSLARKHASMGIARAKAELGDYKPAGEWLKRARREYWSGCGNCAEAEAVWDHPITTVWAKAQLPYKQAVSALTRIVAGQFRPIHTRLSPVDESATTQKRHARDEAALILGEIHLRNSNPGAARPALQLAAKSEYDIAFIARKRLRQIIPSKQ